MKQFAEGLFKGQVMTATKKRGRYLYHVVYEDGDEEDLNDQEFIEAYQTLVNEVRLELNQIKLDLVQLQLDAKAEQERAEYFEYQDNEISERKEIIED